MTLLHAVSRNSLGLIDFTVRRASVNIQSILSLCLSMAPLSNWDMLFFAMTVVLVMVTLVQGKLEVRTPPARP